MMPLRERWVRVMGVLAMRMVVLVAVAAAGLGTAVPVLAQQNDREIIIYGNDRCPSGTVCIRRSESERYRIPPSLRSGELAPADQPWGARASSVSRAAAASGAGSCSAAGAGGFTGCWAQGMKAWRDERKQQARANAASPAPQP